MKKLFRIFLKILKYLGILFCFLIVVLLGMAWWGSLEKRDSYYISDVDFKLINLGEIKEHPLKELMKLEQNFETIKEPLYMSNFHWLKEGEKTALVYLKYKDESITTVDDERFTKVTIVVPKVEVGTFFIDGKNIRGFYTVGGSAWPRNQCGSAIEKGTVIISEVNVDSFIAKIDFDTVCKSKLFKRTEQVSFREEIEFKKLPFSRANGWTGKKEGHIYRETYRH